MVNDAPGSDGFGLGANEDTSNHAISGLLDSAPLFDDHPNTPSVYPGGTTFMDQFFDIQYVTLWQQNLYYPFTSGADWQLASWLLHSHLSMSAINEFLSLQLIKELPISFQSVPTKCKPTIYYCDPVECLQSPFSHPLFASHMSFILWRVWSSSAQIVHIYKDWMSGDHAWNLQILNSAMLLGVVLSSDKTNILVMTGNRVAHPLLLSLANIDSDIHISFIHGKTHVCSLLSNWLIHKSLDFMLKPLKVVTAVGVVMSDPIGNLHYCFTPLVMYIADTLEQSLLVCTNPKASPVSTAMCKEFRDPFPHPSCTAGRTLDDIEWACCQADLDNFKDFLKVTKHYYLNGVHKPFWRDWPLSNPLRFLMPEVLHHFHHLFWDHNLQWCSVVLGSAKIDYRFSLVQMPVRYCSFEEGVSKLKQVTGCDHHAMQRYIVGVITGAVPRKFLVAISALLNFCYLAQMPHFDNDALSRVEAVLQVFHDNKSGIITSGGRQGCNRPLQHWEIPTLELLQHVVPSIHTSGAIMQWMAYVPEHIAWHLDCSEKCFQFNLATCLASIEHGESGEDDEDQEYEHELDLETLQASHYYAPTCTLVNYFEAAEALASGAISNAVLPHRIFASSTAVFQLAIKPSLWVMIDEAAEAYGLSDLCRKQLAIKWSQRFVSHDTFLAYIQCFNVSFPPPSSNTTDSAAAHVIPHFGKEANLCLTHYTSYELSNEFWLNKYWNKEFFYMLSCS
ncbi:hypothetical protein EDC04DRAFT_2602739 [Pisolithus marmoratus]|nr:hypothetical protein EDC04DRAFT_2602739 [Pisolithus marmoratus]